MLVISGSKSKDQTGLGLYSLDSSSELRIFKSHHGFQCRRGLDSRMGIGFKEIYLGNSHGVGQSGVVFHFPKSPKSVSTLAYSSGCFTPICSYTPMCRYILRGHNSCAYSCLLRLTSCPPILGTEDAKNSLGEKSHLVPRKDQKWGSDVGKQEMRVSEMSFRGGIQTGIRDGGIRDQAVTGKLHGYGSDGRDCSISRERLSIPLPMTPGPGSCHHVQ